MNMISKIESEGASPPKLVTRFHKLPQSAGVFVVSLEKDGPAAAAGLREGDIIVSFDSTAITSLDDLHRALTEERIDSFATLGVLRDQQRTDVVVRISDRARH